MSFLGLLSFITVPVDGGSVVMISIGGIKKRNLSRYGMVVNFLACFIKIIFFAKGGVAELLRVRLAKDCSRKRVYLRNQRLCYGIPGVSVVTCLSVKGVTTP